MSLRSFVCFPFSVTSSSDVSSKDVSSSVDSTEFSQTELRVSFTEHSCVTDKLLLDHQQKEIRGESIDKNETAALKPLSSYGSFTFLALLAKLSSVLSSVHRVLQ